MELLLNGKVMSSDPILHETFLSAPFTSGDRAVFVYRKKSKKYELFNPLNLKKGSKYPHIRMNEVRLFLA